MSQEKAQPNSSISLSDKDVKAPNVFERVKEEIEAMLHSERHSHHHHKETHGMRKDIDENTPISGVKAPNVTNGATAELKTHNPDSLSENKAKVPNHNERSEEEI
ncbi:hypothetical protein K7X08_021913 [Anisodus acutangulus]|uniref:Uncharacterized protein n=1 Tax=Anisodus acutangulus TaxID=402998 RepID=A0A9Q1L625_9SOLA|nr:hypothetical protein K7X08_021913 [Anisodus acutangulus]